MEEENDNESEEVKKAPTEKAIQKQYEIVIGILQNETGRFWMRFNIFIGIQLAGMLGILSNLNILTVNEGLFKITMLFCSISSSLFLVICIRGIMSTQMLMKVVFELESKSVELVNLAELIKKHDKLPQVINYYVATLMAMLFAALWWGSLIALVCGYPRI